MSSINTGKYFHTGLLLSLALAAPRSFAASAPAEDPMRAFCQGKIQEARHWAGELKGKREVCRQKQKAARQDADRNAEDDKCGSERSWDGALAITDEKEKYYAGLQAASEKALRSPGEHGPALLRAVLDGLQVNRIEIADMGTFFPFFLRNDEVLKGLMEEAFPMSVKVTWPPEKRNESMETRFLDTLQLNGRKSGIIVSEAGQKWSASQEIRIIPQGETNGWISRRVGGNLRVRAKDGALIASWNNSSAGVHLAAEEAEMQAAENLANSALRHFMLYLLEETCARREKK